uniref:Small ribosomal subunit protein uS3c n=1 Tax=Compsopogon caeruleus TaxID=31354 RepID=A0A1Z1XB39_9RHOD|nr:ribosomal protein S3 [Compsopogon caeruleus]ARX96083.1 ribosomal protein S3 [Compsopogon caeruleus]
MGQKTHPLGFRIGITQTHRSSWFSSPKDYSICLEEDYNIRFADYIIDLSYSYLISNISNAGVARIQIYKKVEQIELEIHTMRPGLIIGRLGTGIELLRKDLQQKLGNNKQIRINIIEVTDPDKEANLIADFIVQQLEKRVAFKRVVRQAIQKAQRANVKGIKIQVSGRLNGAEIARSEWVREGQVPLQTLRADIDYSHKTAQTTYGILGVKVWLFRGELVSQTQKN